MRNDLGELSAFAIVARTQLYPRRRTAGRLAICAQPFHAGSRKEARSSVARADHAKRFPHSSRDRPSPRSRTGTERIERAVAETRKQRESPAGRIRLIIPRTATQMVILPKLAHFARTYPEIVLEVTSSNDPVDLVAGEYDAGVHLGEFIQRDMIAVRVTREMRLAVVGSPQYFKSRNVPRKPQDLKDHSCIGFRFSNGLYRWEFEKGRKALTVSPQGPASFDDPDLVIQAVLKGIGIGTAMEETVTSMISEGRLVQVLKDWCPKFEGYFLYYPSRRNQPAALAALIDTLRLSD